MSVEPDSSTTKVVYVYLRGEGTPVYRPAPATLVGTDVARLAAPGDYNPEDEDWEFKPGMLVRLESKTLGGQKVLVAVSPAE